MSRVKVILSLSRLYSVGLGTMRKLKQLLILMIERINGNGLCCKLYVLIITTAHIRKIFNNSELHAAADLIFFLLEE